MDQAVFVEMGEGAGQGEAEAEAFADGEAGAALEVGAEGFWEIVERVLS